QAALEVEHVVVLIALAAGLGESGAVDDAGVVQFIANDGVLVAEQRFEEPAVGVEAGGVEDRVFLAEELRDVGFELLVQVLRAADEADGGEAETVVAQAQMGGLDDRGVVGEAEVVVGAEVDDVAAVDLDGGILRRLDAALALVEALLLEAVELRAQVLDDPRVAHGGLRQRTITGAL